MIRSFFFSLVLTAGFASAPVLAQSFDTSGNSLLNGQYAVRWVGYDNLSSTTTIGRARSFTGAMTFNGSGSYTLTGQLSINTTASGAPSAFTFSGTYSVGSNGLLQMQNPFTSSETLTGGVGVDAFVASTTDSNLVLMWDLMVGVPIGSSVSNASLQGNFRFGGIDFPGADVTQVRNYTFLAAANGQGSLGNPTVIGDAANLGSTDTTQTVTAATYNASSNAFTLTFPAPSGITTPSLLVSGTKQCSLSTDTNVLVCGQLNGYDMVVGIRAFGGPANSGSFSGVFYSGGLDDDVSQLSTGGNYLDAFYGSANVNGLGTAIEHQRVNSACSNCGPTYDLTFDDEFTITSDGSVTEDYRAVLYRRRRPDGGAHRAIHYVFVCI